MIDEGDFGATTWYLMLARRLDVHDAIKAVDGWAGDQYRTYKEADGRVCITALYQGKTAVDTDRMYRQLQAWSRPIHSPERASTKWSRTRC